MSGVWFRYSRPPRPTAIIPSPDIGDAGLMTAAFSNAKRGVPPAVKPSGLKTRNSVLPATASATTRSSLIIWPQ